MKKILVICGCFLALCLLSSCSFIVGDKDDPHPQNNDPQEQTQEELQDQTQKDPQDPDEIVEPFCNYQDILDAISLLHSQGGSFNDSQYSDLDEREREIYNSLSHFICGGSGYCIKDINNDGVDELILLTEWWNLKGMFTMKDGLPVLLEKCDDGGIGKDGKIRVEYTEETGEYKKTVCRLKSLEDGALVTSAELEEIDFIDGDKTNEYYQIINGERVKKPKYEFSDLRVSYSFRDYPNLTSSADISCTRLLDIPTLRTQGEYFSESVQKNSDGGITYIIKVYDKDGNIVLSRVGEYLSVYEMKVSDQETVVSINYGDGNKNYYNTLENRFSKDFRNENVLAEMGRTIVCMSEKAGEKRLEVRDIFDSSRFYRIYDHELVKGDSKPSVWFSQDGRSITLQDRTTQVLCLETLPILKTKKICYIRYDTSISSGVVMASSGVRAVLRADTNDTIRLLGDGAIVGGEYESDDGTVRNDWYCIDYKGKICYVTADSFEMGYSADIPIEEKTPYAFISEQERLSWKDKIINKLSDKKLYEDYKGIEHLFLGMALMDLNFDNTPELIAAYAGGSMGNVCIVGYDLESGEELCVLGDTPHYNDWDNIYLCVYRNDDGKYFIVNEGSLRAGLESYYITSELTENFNFDVLFEEVKTSGETVRYYCDNNEVDKEEYKEQKIQFQKDHEEIAETQIQIVYWDSIDAKNKSEALSLMADALINSEQKFIDFNK